MLHCMQSLLQRTGKSIGEEEDAEVDDAAAWVMKSRRLEEMQKQKQVRGMVYRLASALSRLLCRLERTFG